MSSILESSFDLASMYATEATSTTYSKYTESRREEDTPSNELSFTDMLELMVVQFQNQTIDNQTDTSEMMNQLVQMSVVQAMTAMTDQMEQLATLNTMTYSASLVGKEVTVGSYDEQGALQEIVGTVTASGTYNGEPVIFVDGVSYLLSSVMAVGRLPEASVAPSTPSEDASQNDTMTDNIPDVDTDNTTDSGSMDAATENNSAEDAVG